MPIFDAQSWLGGSPIPGVANSAKAIAESMRARGIDACALLSAHARAVDPLAGNRVLKAIVSQAPGLHACLVAHSNRVDSSVAAMRELMSQRQFVGMAVAGTQLDRPLPRIVADDLINPYRRYSKPLFLFAPNGPCAEAALAIARSFPMLKVVLLGMGGPDWRTAIAAAQESVNIFLETSGVLDRAKLPAAIEALGPHRVLFGSGSPRMDAAAALGLVEDSGLSSEARQRVLYTNAERLFGLRAPAAEQPA